jgi:hypothetical protein
MYKKISLIIWGLACLFVGVGVYFGLDASWYSVALVIAYLWTDTLERAGT